MASGSGLMNVNFEGRKAIDQAPAPTSVKSVQVRDGGHTTQTDMASMYCSKCSAHVGWKLVRIVMQCSCWMEISKNRHSLVLDFVFFHA